jgi:hypothetical protein
LTGGIRLHLVASGVGVPTINQAVDDLLQSTRSLATIGTQPATTASR